jgi:ribonucleoside-diphosphate reductase alpha chain
MATDFFKQLADKNSIELVEKYGLRNSQLLTIAPTGSLSTMWGISGGIEPIFQISYTRNTKTLNGGQESFYKVFTPIAKEYMERVGIESEEDLPKSFITSSELKYQDRVEMQSVWQHYIDASISSTVNLPKETTVKEVFDLYLLAWKKGLKGITIYRDGCKRAGILITKDTTSTVEQPKSMNVQQLKELMDKKILESILNDPNKCPMCGGVMMHMNGCHECQECAYSPCSI